MMSTSKVAVWKERRKHLKLKTDNKKMEKTISTDGVIEIYKSLEFTIEQLIISKDDSYHWKWAIIGIHSALQISMTSALRDSSGTNILKENIRAKYYKSLREGTFGTVEEKLNYFMELYKDIKSDKLYRYGIERKFIPVGNDDDNIKYLNALRNFFIHFIPMGYGSYVIEFIPLFESSIRVIKFLLTEIPHIIWVEENEKEHAVDSLNKLAALINEVKIELES